MAEIRNENDVFVCDNVVSLLNEGSLTVLNEACKLLDSRSFMLFLLKIEHCNAAYCVSFPEATCYTEIHSHENKVILYPFLNIFTTGKHVLRKCIEEKEMPNEKGAKIAMEKLLKLFQNRTDIEKKFDTDECMTEADWSLRVVHHILSQLAVSSTYVVDSHYTTEANFCPCCKEDLQADVGDTSIGHKDVWHGCIDMFLDSYVAIKVDKDQEEGNMLSKDVNKDTLSDNDNQLLAQSIVFSLVQKKYHPECENYIFPTISLSRNGIVISFYDCEHDVLINSGPLILFDQGLNMQTVLALWLTINYKYFCSGITRHMKDNHYTAGFYKHVGDRRNIYEEKVKFGCGCTSSNDRSFDPGTSFHVDVINDDVPLKKSRLC